MFYVFHGTDHLARDEKVAALLSQRKSDDALAEMNTMRLDGQNLSLVQLREACDPLPMFAERRVIIVTNHLARFDPEDKNKDGESNDAGGGKEGRKASGLSEARKREASALEIYLKGMAESVRLFFLEDKALNAKNPILAFAQKEASDCVKRFDVPYPRELPTWVIKRVKAKGALIDEDAAVGLAEAIGDDLRVIDSEIEKILTYIGKDAPRITYRHLELVPYSGQTNVFKLVDDIGRRNARGALRMLHKLLDEGGPEEPVRLMGMIVRQFRILIKVKELSGQGLPTKTIAQRAGVHNFVAEKAQAQATNFSMAQLEAIYQRLLQTDLEIKTGKMNPVLALGTLVATLCGPLD